MSARRVQWRTSLQLTSRRPPARASVLSVAPSIKFMLAARRAMVAMAQQQSTPPSSLDRAAFQQVIRLPALRVPARYCNDLMRKLRGFTFDLPKTKCVVHDGSRQDVRLLLLKQGTDPGALSPEVASVLGQPGCELVSHDFTLGYQHLSAEQVLKKLLPDGIEVPSSFEAVGHIAHLNLRAEQLPFKGLIGQVLLDKNPALKTIVNKLGSIENEFRVFEMEVLAGEHRFETEVSQHGVRFRLDFSQVYWNSRLEAEHNRLVGSFGAGQLVADVMAGIGPFAVPAGLRGCKVYANDLNPASAKYLALNIALNKVAQQVLPFNLDGRAFIRLLLGTPGAEEQVQQAAELQQQAAEQQQQQQGVEQQQQQQQQQQQPSKKRRLEATVPPPLPPGFSVPPGGLGVDHFVMNLPASAVTFLDAFRGAFDPAAWAARPLPLVHVYTFQKNETDADVLARVEAALGGKLEAPATIHNVRDVAPNKLMLCVSFRVPAAVAFAGRQPEHEQQQQQAGGGGEGGAAAAAAAAAAAEPAVKKPRT